MADLSIPLMIACIGAAGIAGRGNLSRVSAGRRRVAGALYLVASAPALAFLTGVGIHLPVSDVVPMVLGVAGVSMICVEFLLIARDAIRAPDANGISAPD